MQLGPFKYSEGDNNTAPMQGPITLEGGARYVGQFADGIRKGKGKQVW